MTETSSPTAVFRAARDLLLRHRDDYDAARREFAWPALDEFNWALDWFDVIAAEHPDRAALRIVGDDGDRSQSYAELAARSGQVANWLRGLGVRRGDRMLLMLGNVAPLWEVILAAMKLGAVIIPASTLLQPGDLADRIARGGVRHVVTDTAQAAKFGGIPGDWTRIAVEADSAGPAGAGAGAGRGGGAGGRARRAAGTTTRPRSARRCSSRQTGRPGRATCCCCTSPPAPPPSPSWSRTPTPATRSGTCPRCTGSASSPATCT